MRTKNDLIFATKFIYESNLIENINIPFEEIWKEWGQSPLRGHPAALIFATVDADQKKQ